MSHITLAQQGIAAVDAREWDEAIAKLSKALQTSENPNWLIARSKALIGAKRYQEALEDANLAWHKAYARNKRDALAEAHYRRAVAYYRLKEYANADCCCIYSMRVIKGHPAVEKTDPTDKYLGENRFWTQTVEDAKKQSQDEEAEGRKGGLASTMSEGSPKVSKEWRMANALRVQILSAMEKLPEDDPGRKVSASLKPPQKKLADVSTGQKQEEVGVPTTAGSSASTVPVVPPAKTTDAPMRLQDFQNDSTMTVSIFSKGNKKETLEVNILPNSVSVQPIIYPNGEAKAFHLDLWGEIDPETSKYTVTPSKVELSLKKKTAGKWPQLRSDSASATKSSAMDEGAEEERLKLEALKEARKKAIEAAEKASPQPATQASVPSYPTSSRGGPKNWDKLAEDSDHEEDDGVNTFFKKIYKGATPEQQRAMMKSFVESNGTTLSTDWNDVKDRTVETKPPEGVEAKKWD